MNTLADLERKIATITRLDELEGFAKQLDAQGELTATVKQMIKTREAEIERAQLRRR